MTTHGDYSNHRGIFNPNQFSWPVTVIGMGGIGSAVVLALHKMGVKEIIAYDDDVVSSHNLPVQMLYSQRDLTEPPTPKVVAAERFLKEHQIDSGQIFTGRQQRITAETPVDFSGAVVMAVDTMKARSELWQLLQLPQNAINVPLVFDCRMGGDGFQLFTIDPRDPTHIAIYESWLFEDDEADDEPYGERAFVGVTLSLAGHVASRIAQLSRGEVMGRPFYEYNLGDVFSG